MENNEIARGGNDYGIHIEKFNPTAGDYSSKNYKIPKGQILRNVIVDGHHHGIELDGNWVGKYIQVADNSDGVSNIDKSNNDCDLQ